MNKYIYTTIFLLFNSILCFAQWTTNTSVNVEAAGTESYDYPTDHQIATTSDGKTWIAFYRIRSASNYDMRAQLLDAGGNKLLGPDGVLVCDQTSGSATFVFNVCLDASDNLIIAFQYEVAGTATAVITKVNIDGSLPWGINGTQLGAGLSPYPALLTTGETAVAWNNNSPSTLYIQKISTAGTTVWGAPIAVTVGGTNTTRGQLVPNPGGYFTMVFQKKVVGVSTTLYAQRYNNDGIAQWLSPVQISTLSTSAARYYSIVVDADITYFGYYASSGSRFFSYVQKINSDGSLPWGANGSVFSTYSTGSDPYQQTTNIAHAPGSPYVWSICVYSNTAQTFAAVYVQKFDAATGAVLFDPLGKVVYAMNNIIDLPIGMLRLANDEPLFITMNTYNQKIYAVRLNSSGNFAWAGDHVELSSTTSATSEKSRPYLTELVNNQVVAVWQENRQVGALEFNEYAQQVNAFGVIPVKLGELNAIKNGRSVNLYWNTLTESNNKGFYVERSSDGINYKKIGFVNSKAIGGNSSLNLDYAFTDLQPLQSYNYYRLAQVDLDEKNTYSKTVLVRFDKQGVFFISNIYPAPATTAIHVSVESGIKIAGTLFIVDMNGKVVRQSAIHLNKGNNIFNADIKTLAKGMYILKIVADDDIVAEKWLKK